MPKSKAMDVYNARAGTLSAAVSNKRFAIVNPLDAQAKRNPQTSSRADLSAEPVLE